MNVFITGATGFIGKNLVKVLSQNKRLKIFCLVRKKSKKKDRDFLKKQGIVLTYDLSNLSKCRIIYHLAGQLHEFNLDESVYWKSNYFLTKKVIEQCKNNQKIIFLSTTGVHGPGNNFNENSKFNPINIYEKTKLESELLVQSYGNYVIIRSGLVIGRYNRNLRSLHEAMKKGWFFIIGKGNNIIQPIDVQILAEVMVKAQKFTDEIFIIAGKKILFKDYYKMIAKQNNVQINRIKIPEKFMRAFVFLYQNFCRLLNIRPIISLDGVDLLTQTRTYDISKSKHYFKEMKNLR
ncbi:MAG: NAD-dependent epimerase/dehydratase family protein [Candidatus Woesearchaeota archaeon]